MINQLNTLGDVCENINRPFNFNKLKQVILINTGDVLDGKFLHNNFSKVDELPGQAKKAVKKGDIIYSEIRPINRRFAYIKDDMDEHVVSTKFMVLKSNDKINSKYLYYYLSCNSSIKQFQMEAETRSGTFPQITFESISYLPIYSPARNEQNEIVKLFDLIEDKIDLNQKINRNLQDIASRLFKSWFIDFDLVRDKEKRNNFTDSELGKIPKEWTLNKLGDHIKLIKGKSYKSSELKKSDTALVTLKSFKRNGGYREDGLKEYVGTFKEEQVVKEGDLIVAFTDVTQAAEVIGKPAIVIGNKKYSKLVISLDVASVQIRQSSSLSKNFIYFLMLTKRYASNSLGYTNGTNVLHLDKKAITNFCFCLPPNNLVKIFDQISADILKKITLNIHENNVLKDLRNLLLPKFISGELKISDFDKIKKEKVT